MVWENSNRVFEICYIFYSVENPLKGFLKRSNGFSLFLVYWDVEV